MRNQSSNYRQQNQPSPWSRTTTLCSSCSCLLGTNQQCCTCDQLPLPDSFQQKINTPAYDYWCPAITHGQRCNNLLGKGSCPLCLFHLHLIKKEKNFHQQILGSSFEWTKVLTNFYTNLNSQKKIPSNTTTKNPPRASPGNSMCWTSALSTSRLAPLLHPRPPSRPQD